MAVRYTITQTHTTDGTDVATATEGLRTMPSREDGGNLAAEAFGVGRTICLQVEVEGGLCQPGQPERTRLALLSSESAYPQRLQFGGYVAA